MEGRWPGELLEFTPATLGASVTGSQTEWIEGGAMRDWKRTGPDETRYHHLKIENNVNF